MEYEYIWGDFIGVNISFSVVTLVNVCCIFPFDVIKKQQTFIFFIQ